ncbi:unnamed protein product [Fraxinus pennsylvanica]|uniref:Uncharacterized protein n=1 Tax=Fraxinus pennsylvanica TaxID=56036 RepID=A0AAD2E4U8_9LAMI|nr:unnamed protein product [Fraxinus pennsylvanica]
MSEILPLENELFEDRQVENEQFNRISGCPTGCPATIFLRGGVDGWCRRSKYLLHTVELRSSNLNKITNRASVKCEGVSETIATLSSDFGFRLRDGGMPEFD